MPNNIYKTLTSSQMNEARIHWHPLTSTDIHWQSSGRKFHPLKSTENDCQSVQWLHVKRSPYNPCFWSAPDWHKMHFSDLLSFPAITRTAAPLPCSDVRNFLRLIFYPIKVALLATLNHHYWWWENCDLHQTYFAAQQAVMGPGPGCKIPRHDDNLHSEVLLFLVQFVCGHNFFCRFCT